MLFHLEKVASCRKIKITEQFKENLTICKKKLQNKIFLIKKNIIEQMYIA